MEYQILAEFVRVLKVSKHSRIEAPLLQYLSIMMQNIDGELAICKTIVITYYIFLNGYIMSLFPLVYLSVFII